MILRAKRSFYIFLNFLCSCIVKDLGYLSPVGIKIAIDFFKYPQIEAVNEPFQSKRLQFSLRNIARKMVGRMFLAGGHKECILGWG